MDRKKSVVSFAETPNEYSLTTIDEESVYSSNDYQLTKFNKYTYTALLCYANLTYGISITCFSPTLVDFSKILDEEMETISHYYSLFAIGTIIGSMFGLLFKYINRQITLTVILFLFAIATTAQPHVPNFYYLFLCGFVSGMGAGALDVVQTVWLLEMWDEKSGSILQLSEATFGCGAVIGPLIAESFIKGEQSNSQETLEINMSVHHNETIDYNLITPFAITGSFQFLAAVLLGIMYFYHKYQPMGKTEEEVEKEIEEVLRPIEKIYHRRYSVQILENKVEDNHNIKPRFSIQINNVKTLEKLDHNLPYKRRFSSFHHEKPEMYKPPEKLPRKTLICVGAIGFATIIAAESAFIDFSPTFFQKYNSPNVVSGGQSALLLTSMTSCYTISRFCAIYIASKVRPQYILMYHYVILFVAIILLYFSQDNKVLIWMGNVIFGIGISTFWSATFSHIEEYFEITDRVGSMYVSLLGFIMIGTQFIEGPLIEPYPIVVLYYVTIAALVSLSAFITIRIIVWRVNRVTKSNTKHNENVSKI